VTGSSHYCVRFRPSVSCAAALVDHFVDTRTCKSTDIVHDSYAEMRDTGYAVGVSDAFVKARDNT
jgi:hypothetical protein